MSDKEKCDCLNFCGDDERVSKGLVTPCLPRQRENALSELVTKAGIQASYARLAQANYLTLDTDGKISLVMDIIKDQALHTRNLLNLALELAAQRKKEIEDGVCDPKTKA